MSGLFRLICGAAAAAMLLQPVAAEQISEETAACNPSMLAGKKSSAVFSGSAFVIVATLIEEQGKGHIQPAYEEPKSKCTAEIFEADGYAVTAVYSGFEPGMQTLLYRFSAEKEQERRELLVLYNGMLSLVQKSGPHFYVAESRAGRTSLYAMYDNEPDFFVLKTLITDVLSGGSEPLIAVEWPEDSDELVIVAFDSKRLK